MAKEATKTTEVVEETKEPTTEEKLDAVVHQLQLTQNAYDKLNVKFSKVLVLYSELLNKYLENK